MMAAFDVGGLFSAVYRTQSLLLLTIYEEDKEQRLFLLECSRTLTGDYTSLRVLSSPPSRMLIQAGGPVDCSVRTMILDRTLGIFSV